MYGPRAHLRHLYIYIHLKRTKKIIVIHDSIKFIYIDLKSSKPQSYYQMCQTSHGWPPPHRYCDIGLTLQNHLHRHNKDKRRGPLRY